jgi:hypothetical protein
LKALTSLVLLPLVAVDTIDSSRAEKRQGEPAGDYALEEITMVGLGFFFI